MARCLQASSREKRSVVSLLCLLTDLSRLVMITLQEKRLQAILEISLPMAPSPLEMRADHSLTLPSKGVTLARHLIIPKAHDAA